ncbi:FKBP-type peptidyl-prolyl cis-trans isomerase [Ekhidna sp.]|uniref:FKBP-type peptidyl-prolyl cis-trans isomerase n=1 Tax=Ekhidna sp. TaxID=2608089 RepID=UPI003C7DC4FD
MKKLILLLSIFSISLLFSCGSDDGDSVSFEEQLARDIEIIDQYLADNNINATVHESGIRYTLNNAGNSMLPSIGDDIAVKYAGYYFDGTLLGSDTIGLTFTLDTGIIVAWLEMLSEIGEGGEITFYAPSGYCFGAQGNGVVPPNTNLIYNVELLGVIDSEEEQLDIDTLIIDEYLQESGIDYEVDLSGIRYQILAEGTGASPTVNDNVFVKYEGAFLNGNVFDSNSTGVQFGLQNLIEAWKIMIPTMKEGGKIKIFAPSEYCYGPAGNQAIPPNTILTFEIELIEVR